MTEQNFSNHSRLVPGYHFVTGILCIFILFASILKFKRNYETHHGGLLVPTILILMSIALILVAYFARTFALKAQDRGIRAEESLRYYAISGNLPDSRLTISQIIALRFAPNNELLDLAHRAVNENLTSKQIKQAIQNWKGDLHRV